VSIRKVGGYIRPWTAAEYLGISLEEVQKMLESGELPGIKIDGQWRVSLQQLESWLDEEVSEKDLRKLAGHIDVSTKEIDSFLNETVSEDQGADKKKSNGIAKKKRSK
jgi:excisionase family DNA binding protein